MGLFIKLSILLDLLFSLKLSVVYAVNATIYGYCPIGDKSLRISKLA